MRPLISLITLVNLLTNSSSRMGPAELFLRVAGHLKQDDAQSVTGRTVGQ